MPATSIRDLVIKNDDIVVGTHGRSFWILDDIMPLREISSRNASEEVMLYKPETAYRVRWSLNTDTPLPPDEPAGTNPPDGAIIDYYFKDNVTGSVTLDISDAKGNIVHHFSSEDKPYDIPKVNIPLYWIRPQEFLSTKAGSHRFIWDLHYTPLHVPIDYPMSAVFENTAPEASSSWVMPGRYKVTLTVSGKQYNQQLMIQMDPRVRTTAKELQQQFDLSLICFEGRKQVRTILDEITDLQTQIKALSSTSTDSLHSDLNLLDRQLTLLKNPSEESQLHNFQNIENAFATLFSILQETDMPATTQTVEGIKQSQKDLKTIMAQWMDLKNSKLTKMNDRLRKAGLKPLIVRTDSH